MDDLRDLRSIAKDKLDVEEIVRNVEVVRTGRTLRRAFEGTLFLSFLLLTLHSLGLMQLPPLAVQTISSSIPLAVVGLLTNYVHLLWKRRV